MKKYIIVFFFLIVTQSFASVQKIVAIVNDDPITLSELNERARLIAFFSNVSPDDHNQNIAIRKLALENLIDEQLLFQQEKTLGIKIDEQSIDNGITNIEDSNKMSKGQLALILQENNISNRSFRNKVKCDILKSRIFSEVLLHGVTINSNDLEAVILNRVAKDAEMTLKIFSAIGVDQKSYNKMRDLGKKIKNCNLPKAASYKDIASLEEVNLKFSKLDPQMKNIVRTLKVGSHSGVIKIQDRFKIVMVCGRKIDKVSDKENNYLVNFLTNKKLTLKLKKYQEDLRKKAYIKIL